MGSSGVTHEKLGEIQKNVFGVLDFDGDGADLSVYSVHQTDDSSVEWTVRIPRGRVEGGSVSN